MSPAKGARKTARAAPGATPTKGAAEDPSAEPARVRTLWWGATIAMTLAVYASTLGGDWLWDDEALVTSGRLMHGAAGLARIWRGDGTLDYFPLTLTSFWLESLFSDGPTIHRVVNLALHALNACLVGAVLSRARVPGARAAGLLFAVHPLAVSSVAWISERKNTLSLCFGLLALCAALPREHRWPTSRELAAAVFLFALALLGKTQLVALPIVMLGLLTLREGPVPRRGWVAFGAMLAVALGLGIVTMRFQRPPQGVDAGPALERIVRAADAVAFYLSATLWPSPLAMIRARDTVDGTRVGAYVALAALVLAFVLLALAIRARKPWGKPLLVALVAYVALLGPTLGLLEMSFMRFAWVAEHFAYVALPVPLACLVALGARAPREVRAGALLIAAATLAFVAHSHAGTFTSLARLWAHNVDVVPQSPAALGNYALEQQAAGRHEEALSLAREAVALAPRDGELRSFLGTVLMQQGRLDEARRELTRAIELDPSLARAHNNLATLLVQEGRLDDAADHLRAALEITPDYAVGHMNLARLLAARGRVDEAEAERAIAIELDPALASMPLVPPAP